MKLLNTYPARCGLAVISGAVYAQAYPPLGWGWLVLPGIVGLIVALRDQQGTRARALGFLHGLTAFALSLSWLYEIFGALVVMLWFVLAAFPALFAEMQARASRRGLEGWKFAAFTAVNWCGWEFIRAELFPLKFPWMTAGLALGPNSLLPWIGVYGTSLFVVVIAALFAMRWWKSALAICLMMLGCVILPSRIPVPREDDSRALKVAGLQLESVSLTEYLAGSRQMADDVRYVVWPEYAAPFDVRANKREWANLQALCRERNITLTLGTQARPDGGDTWRNIALTLDPTGSRGEHTKVHTVHFFDDGTPGTAALPVETAHGKIGTPICFDCDYEGIVRRMTAAGAEFFVVPTMDAEKWTGRQHDQHAELFRIRACENGRWMFVVATSGVSQLIDPNGRVHVRLDALRQGRISGTLKRETGLTFYTRVGWMLPWCMLAAAAACWLWLLFPRKRGSATLNA